MGNFMDLNLPTKIRSINISGLVYIRHMVRSTLDEIPDVIMQSYEKDGIMQPPSPYNMFRYGNKNVLNCVPCLVSA